ncbi:hypothetical protein STEG23_024521 [Scotinomys teguina]
MMQQAARMEGVANVTQGDIHLWNEPKEGKVDIEVTGDNLEKAGCPQHKRKDSRQEGRGFTSFGASGEENEDSFGCHRYTPPPWLIGAAY